MPKIGLRTKVAIKIKLLRLKRKLTQEKTAELSGFHYKYYQQIEAGDVNLTLDSIERLAKTLRITPKNLLP